MPFFDPKIENDRIRHKRSFVEGEVPADGTLRPGELAVNVADGIAFIGDANGITRRVSQPNQIVSASGLGDLTEEQQAAVATGTVVTTADGKRWVYSGEGSKTDAESYVELADITPVWSVIANKPSTFPPSTHTHGTEDVSGLSGMLEGLANDVAGKAAAQHGHSISDVTNLQDALNDKAGATHGHSIGDVSFLQESLNAKADAGHGHAVEDVAGLGDVLGTKVSSAPEWTANHALVTGGRYLAGDFVWYEGSVYVAINDNESLPVSNTQYWAYVGPGLRLNIDGRDIPNLPAGGGYDQSLNTTDAVTFQGGVTTGSVLSTSGVTTPSLTLQNALGSPGVITFSDGSTQVTAAGLPSGSEGQILTYSGGTWTAMSPTGSLPAGQSGAALYYDGSNWVNSNDMANSSIVLRISPMNGYLATVAPVSAITDGPSFRIGDTMGTFTELYSQGVRFSDGTNQVTAAVPVPSPSGIGNAVPYSDGTNWSYTTDGSSADIILRGAPGSDQAGARSWSINGGPCLYASSNMGLTTELYSGGIKFPDGSTLTTALGAGGLPAGNEGWVLTYSNGAWISAAPPGSLPSSSGYGYLLMSNGTSWVTTGDAGESAYSLLKYGYWNTNSYAYAVNTDVFSGSQASIRVTSDNGGSYTEMNSSGFKWPDGTIQFSAGVSVPSPASGAVPVYDGMYWKASTTADNSLEVIFRYAWGDTSRYCYATSTGAPDTGPSLRVTSNSAMNYMEMYTQGLRFPDGTTQTTAATGGGKVLAITTGDTSSMMGGGQGWPSMGTSGFGFASATSGSFMGGLAIPVTPGKYYKVTVFLAVDSNGASTEAAYFGLSSNGGSSGTYAAFGGLTVYDDGGYVSWDSITDGESPVVYNMVNGTTYTFGSQEFIILTGGGDTELVPYFKGMNSITLKAGSWIMVEQLN